MKKSIFILLVLCVQLVSASEKSYQYIMPKILVDYGIKHGCTPISDEFYQIEGNYLPPFVFGVLEGKKDESAAFLCRKTGGNGYDVMIYVDPKSSIIKRCPISTYVNSSLPFGLTVEQKEWDLEALEFTNDDGEIQTGKIKAKAILMTNDYYVTVGLICHNGEWLEALLAH